MHNAQEWPRAAATAADAISDLIPRGTTQEVGRKGERGRNKVASPVQISRILVSQNYTFQKVHQTEYPFEHKGTSILSIRNSGKVPSESVCLQRKYQSKGRSIYYVRTEGGEGGERSGQFCER